VTAGPSKRRGAQGSLPPTPPSRRVWVLGASNEELRNAEWYH